MLPSAFLHPAPCTSILHHLLCTRYVTVNSTLTLHSPVPQLLLFTPDPLLVLDHASFSCLPERPSMPVLSVSCGHGTACLLTQVLRGTEPWYRRPPRHSLQHSCCSRRKTNAGVLCSVLIAFSSDAWVSRGPEKAPCHEDIPVLETMLPARKKSQKRLSAAPGGRS